jgi:hypothetical protein
MNQTKTAIVKCWKLFLLLLLGRADRRRMTPDPQTSLSDSILHKAPGVVWRRRAPPVRLQSAIPPVGVGLIRYLFGDNVSQTDAKWQGDKVTR